jgi:2'-5' RNA ligase
MVKPIRSFIAVDIDDRDALKRLSDVQETLTKSGADLKLVKPENIHITMRFLGNITPQMVDKIHGAMGHVAFAPFTAEIRGVGVFPTLKYARVVWAGIRTGVEQLEDIFDQLEPHLQDLGIKPDKKGFSPHITIARVRTGRHKAELIQCLNELANFEFGVLKVACLKLKKSTLTPRGPIYSTLKEVCPEG